MSKRLFTLAVTARVGRPAAKELFPNPENGKPMILDCIERHLLLAAPFHVISRSDKQELNDFLNAYSVENSNLNLEVQKIFASKEWPETVLASESYWRDWNLLLLPDTSYEPLLSRKILADALSQAQNQKVSLVFGTFEVDHPKVWGVIKFEKDQIQIAEKPLDVENGTAWGWILFRKEWGRELFSKLLDSGADHQWKNISSAALNFPLIRFTDYTRTFKA